MINQYSNGIQETFDPNILLENVEFIKSHNELYEAGELTYQLGVNHLAGLPDFEFKKMLGYKPDAVSMSRGIQDTFLGYISFAFGLLTSFYLQLVCPKVPENDNTLVDFRIDECWGKILDQGQCGSCYAFSAMQVMNFNKCIKCNNKGTPPDYTSEQNIIDCSKDDGNNGCNGGLMDYVFAYVKKAKGVNLEGDYPYEAKEGDCRYKSDKAKYKQVTGYTKVKKCETEMMKLLDKKIALCVAIKVTKAFQLYKSGVYGDKTSCLAYQRDLNHAVVIGGYGVDDKTGLPYWLIKNTWSEKWGEAGYIRILRGSCCLGVCLSVGYPEFNCDADE